MRIKGVPLEEAAPKVQQLYRKVAEQLGRVTIPLTAFAHWPGLPRRTRRWARRSRDRTVEPRLKTFACVRAAQITGCPF